MEILPVTLQRGVLLSLRLEDGRLAFWLAQQNCWTSIYTEGTLFQTQAAALAELASGRNKMEAAFLISTGSGVPLPGG